LFKKHNSPGGILDTVQLRRITYLSGDFLSDPTTAAALLLDESNSFMACRVAVHLLNARRT
jgi:hypothetical protein